MHISKKKTSSTSSHTSSEIVKKIIDNELSNKKETYSNEEIRDILLNLSTQDFFQHYANRETYEEMPLLTSDNIVIPEAGLRGSSFQQRYCK